MGNEVEGDQMTHLTGSDPPNQEMKFWVRFPGGVQGVVGCGTSF